MYVCMYICMICMYDMYDMYVWYVCMYEKPVGQGGVKLGTPKQNQRQHLSDQLPMYVSMFLIAVCMYICM